MVIEAALASIAKAGRGVRGQEPHIRTLLASWIHHVTFVRAEKRPSAPSGRAAIAEATEALGLFARDEFALAA